jgi:hypothetical protein
MADSADSGRDPSSPGEAGAGAEGRPREGDAPSGIEEAPGRDPGAVDRERDPHHKLNNPAGEPDPTEWPDPYEKRPDPRFPEDDPLAGEAEDVHTQTGSLSTSEPHPDVEPPERENLDE